MNKTLIKLNTDSRYKNKGWFKEILEFANHENGIDWYVDSLGDIVTDCTTNEKNNTTRNSYIILPDMILNYSEIREFLPSKTQIYHDRYFKED